MTSAMEGWALGDPSTWQWLNPDQVLATTSALTVLVLAAAGWFAWRQLEHARTTRAEQTRPFMVVDIVGVRGHHFRLELSNIGATIAKDVSLKFDPELKSTLDRPGWQVKDARFLSQPISSVPPDKTYRLLFDTGPARANSGLPDRYEVNLRYTSHDGTLYEDHQVVDLGPFWGAPDIRDHDLHDIHDRLEGIGKSLKAIDRAVRGLQPPPPP